jgi:demethylmenaquinone methyltransferase/2-methoxy-6-polyprenyl-1,4-benzoquinol methylase
MSEPVEKPEKNGLGTSFGFADVDASSKQGLVNQVFSRVASRYDLMNDLMSGGLHRLWKDELVTALGPPKGDQPYSLLDVAGGTGDVALRFLGAAGSGTTAIICDINEEMMEAGRGRSPHNGRLSFVRGNAEALPFASRSVDAYAIAFGMRNLTNLDAALEEAFRVLKLGGRFVCLEFSSVEMPILDSLYEAYSFQAIPALGAVVAGDADSYRYLVESIRRFPDQRSFARLIEGAGFERVTYRNLTGGIAAIHSGWRI